MSAATATTPPDTATALAAAEAAHAGAIARHQQLVAAAAAARREADTAARLPELRIAEAGAGEALDLDARAAAANHAAETAARIANAATRQTQAAEVAMLRVRAAHLLARLREAVAREIATAERIDGALSEAVAVLAELQDAAAETSRLSRECQMHDIGIQALVKRNEIAAAAQTSGAGLPETRVMQLASSTRYTIHALWSDNWGAQHILSGNIADRLAAEWGALSPRKPNAPTSIRPVPGRID